MFITMTEIEALDVIRRHRTEHAKKEPNELITDEALKVAAKCINYMIRFHEFTDNKSGDEMISVKEFRRYILQGKK